MKSVVYSLLVTFTLSATSATDWRQWRGPSGQNYATGSNTGLPIDWSASNNVLWRAEVPGRGHSSPILVGDRLFLTSADEETGQQIAVCYDRASGDRLWATVLHDGHLPKKIHKKNTHASPTPASDGELVFATFHSEDEIRLSALSIAGEVVWEIRVGDYHDRYNFGYGASPLFFEGTIIVVSEDKEAGFLAAFDRSDGSEVWRTPTGDNTSYSSPVVARAGGREQLVLSGHKALRAWDPRTGRKLWETQVGPLATCGTPVWDDERIYFSGGFPNKESAAVTADGTVVWTNNRKAYEQSLLVHEGHVYCVDDGGIAYCWRASDGEELWRERLDGGGPISASPILANGLIYVSMERGESFVFRADPATLEVLATNRLGDSAFASPVIADGKLFLRVGETTGADYQEFLYCIGR